MHDISEWMRSGVDNANDLHHAKKNSALPYSLQQPGELVDGSDRTPPAGSRPEFEDSSGSQWRGRVAPLSLTPSRGGKPARRTRRGDGMLWLWLWF